MPETNKINQVETESIRKLSNFNLQWAKTLYTIVPEYFKPCHIILLHFSRAIGVICFL